MDLSIVIVSFNTRDLTLGCVESVIAQTQNIRIEVIVLDNDSQDGSARAVAACFPDVHLIRAAKNLGFAAANNRAAQEARGKYLLLLNSDTVVLGEAIQKALAFARAHPDVIVGGRTMFGDGSLNPSSCHGMPTPWSVMCKGIGLSSLFRNSSWFDPESLGSWQRDTVRDVDAVTGCFFLIRRDLWEKLGGFDESFFMYGEETDLCLRARKLGYKCMICPEAKLIHYGGASEKVRADKMVKLFAAKARLFQKHWSPVSARFGVCMLDLWALTRVLGHAALSPLRSASRTALASWWKVWKRRGQWRNSGGPMSPASNAPVLEPVTGGVRV